jgi:hypothetical protein
MPRFASALVFSSATNQPHYVVEYLPNHGLFEFCELSPMFLNKERAALESGSVVPGKMCPR